MASTGATTSDGASGRRCEKLHNCQGQQRIASPRSNRTNGAKLEIADAMEVITTPLNGKRAGRWSPEEKLLFLHGLKMFGRGKWKKIQTFLPTRSLVQIKSHAQKVVKRWDSGESIFAPLKSKESLLSMLLAKRSSGPSSLQSKSPSKSRSRPIPRPKLKPRPQALEVSEGQGSTAHFPTGNRHHENDSNPPFFRTKFGASNVSFSFHNSILQARNAQDDESNFSPSLTSEILFPASTLTPATSDCLTPARPSLHLIESNSVMAAAALCQLSTVGWEKKSLGKHSNYNIVSP